MSIPCNRRFMEYLHHGERERCCTKAATRQRKHDVEAGRSSKNSQDSMDFLAASRPPPWRPSSLSM